jgi:hypothetical protein
MTGPDRRELGALASTLSDLVVALYDAADQAQDAGYIALAHKLRDTAQSTHAVCGDAALRCSFGVTA